MVGAAVLDDFEEHVRKIFEIIPDEEEARIAASDFLTRFRGELAEPANHLRWAELTPAGGFARGGKSDLKQLTTQTISDPDQDEGIRELAAALKRVPPEAGRILASQSGEQFFWVLPGFPGSRDVQQVPRLVAIVVTEALLNQVLSVFNSQRKISPAEARTIFQLISGLSLRDAAAADNVAFETKRAQIKSVYDKMTCSGQVDLVRVVIGQMTQLLALVQSESSAMRVTEDYIARYLADIARFHFQRLPNGHVIRVLECGDLFGTPVVMSHGVLFPAILKGTHRFLEVSNIRLIVPLRPGYLEAQDHWGVDPRGTSETDFQQDLALFIDRKIREPVRLVGNSMGAAHAIAFNLRFPEHVAALTLMSANFANTKTSNLGTFDYLLYSARKIANRPGFLRTLAWQFRKIYMREKTSSSVLDRLFDKNSYDTDALPKDAKGAIDARWFMDLFGTSVAGIADDFHTAFSMDLKSMQGLSKMVSVIHGSDDRLSPPRSVQAATAAIQDKRWVTVQNAGHLAAISHSEKVWPLMMGVSTRRDFLTLSS